MPKDQECSRKELKIGKHNLRKPLGLKYKKQNQNDPLSSILMIPKYTLRKAAK